MVRLGLRAFGSEGFGFVGSSISGFVMLRIPALLESPRVWTASALQRTFVVLFSPSLEKLSYGMLSSELKA